LRPLYFSLLFAGAIRKFPARPVWRAAGVVSQFSSVLSCAAHSLDTRLVPFHLLLLSRSVLQVVLGGPSSLRGERTAKDVSGGTKLSAHHAEFSSLFSATFLHCVGISGLRRCRRVHLPGRIRDRNREPGYRCQHRSSCRLY